MKIDPETITVTKVESPAMAISFVHKDARYHIWVNQENGEIQGSLSITERPILYKNSIHPRGHPEYFLIRYLDATAKGNAAICAQLIELAQPKIALARAEVAARLQAERDTEAKRVQELKWLDAAIARLDHNDGREIEFNDVMTVLEFAQRMRAEGRE
jgi:Mg-chelatase subunit ChlI